ncbi:hypothetical protein [Bradyrhizobium sp. dw_411]|uniref:hypothetical protein n=1 Tax=Bradyrhizobium sp. dw_411 TaxID=2720082 RepID=UPI001BCC9E2E|nr:hypothetical protein [Bradyrhizobium sp. dw_411]
MPAFTFEKITPPSSGPVSSVAKNVGPSVAKKQRGVIVQILDRFVETRVKRTLSDEKGVAARKPKSR